MVGGPVQCNGTLEGILTDAGNEKFGKENRIYLVTRFDNYYEFIYEAVGYRRLTKAAILNASVVVIPSSGALPGSVQLQDESKLVRLWRAIKEKVLFWYHEVIDFPYEAKHNIIWNILPMVFKIIGVVGRSE